MRKFSLSQSLWEEFGQACKICKRIFHTRIGNWKPQFMTPWITTTEILCNDILVMPALISDTEHSCGAWFINSWKTFWFLGSESITIAHVILGSVHTMDASWMSPGSTVSLPSTLQEKKKYLSQLPISWIVTIVTLLSVTIVFSQRQKQTLNCSLLPSA